MIFDGSGLPHRSSLTDQTPSLGPNELLIQMSMATICGSDLHTYEGRRPAPTPCVLGHEGIGVIIGIGSGRDPFLLGKRVTWTLTDTCGCCAPCQEWDLPQKCHSLLKYGHSSINDGSGFEGCFASHLILRGGTEIVILPDKLPDAYVAPANCALATMVAVVEKIPPQAKKVLIQGAGLLGLYGTALLRHRGVAEILVSDPIPTRTDLISHFGGKEFTMADDHEKTFDAVIEVAGVPEVIEEGIRLLRPGGTYVLAGMVHEETRFEICGLDLVRGCVSMIGVHNYAARHLSQGIDFLASTQNDFPWEKLVSPPLPLSKIDEAFALAQTRKWARVSVIPDEFH